MREETVEEFLARGGKIEVAPSGETAATRKKKCEDNAYTDAQMRDAENEVHCKRPFYQ